MCILCMFYLDRFVLEKYPSFKIYKQGFIIKNNTHGQCTLPCIVKFIISPDSNTGNSIVVNNNIKFTLKWWGFVTELSRCLTTYFKAFKRKLKLTECKWMIRVTYPSLNTSKIPAGIFGRARC